MVDQIDPLGMSEVVMDAVKRTEDASRTSLDVQQTRLGVAIVGLGIGQQHARAYLETGRCDLRWFYDLDQDKAADLASRWGTQVAPSLERILADPSVQLVSIASYDDAHFTQVKGTLEAGKHVFVEKPLCRTLDELELIKQLLSREGCRQKIGSNLILRAAPFYRWLKERIKENHLGDIYSCDGEYLYGRLHKITKGWRKDVPNYSVIEGGAIHLVDLMLWLTEERPESVFAAGNRICTKGTAFQYADFVTATLQFPSGLIGRVTANFGCVHRHQHVVRVYGTQGTVLSDDAGPRIHQSRDPALSGSLVNLATLPESKGELIGPFVKAILEDQDLCAETQSFLDDVSVCVACEQSLISNSVEKVHYL